jgi:hypothetical protein
MTTETDVLPEPVVVMGLTATDAADRLRRDGPNELPQENRRGPGASCWTP